MIALAIALGPELIIADELTTALDVIVQAKILDLLAHLRDSYETAIIVITHDLSIALERCDTITVMYAAQLVELASSLELYRNALHLYTKALLLGTPNFELDSQQLPSIPGSPPDLLNIPKGCRFSPRCTFAMDRCKSEVPKLVEPYKGHQVRCFLHEGERT